MWLTVANEMWVAMTYTILSRCFKDCHVICQLSFSWATGTSPETWVKRTQSRATADPWGICYLSKKKNFSQKMVKNIYFLFCTKTKFKHFQFGRCGPEIAATLQERLWETLGRMNSVGIWLLIACVLSTRQCLIHSRWSTNIC